MYNFLFVLQNLEYFEEQYSDPNMIVAHRPKKPWYKPNFTKDTFKVHEGDGFDSDFESFCSSKLDVFLETITENYKLSYQVKYFPKKRNTCDFVLEYNNIIYWIEVSTYKKEQNKKYFENIEKKRKWIQDRGEPNEFVFINNKREMNEFINQLKNY